MFQSGEQMGNVEQIISFSMEDQPNVSQILKAHHAVRHLDGVGAPTITANVRVVMASTIAKKNLVQLDLSPLVENIILASLLVTIMTIDKGPQQMDVNTL